MRISSKESIPYLFWLTLFLIVYLTTAKFGLRLGTASTFAAWVWPPSGIVLFAMYCGGYRLWPSVFLGSFFTNLPMGAHPLTCAGVATGNVLEGILGVYLLKKVFQFNSRFEKTRDVIAFSLVSLITSAGPSAVIGVTSLALEGFVLRENFVRTWLVWWWANAVSDFILGSFLFICLNLYVRRRHLRSMISAYMTAEFSILLIALSFWSAFVFFQKRGFIIPSYMLMFSFFPFVIWAAIRFKQFGAIISSLVISTFIVIGALKDLGPYGGVFAAGNTLPLQTSLFIVAVMALFVAAIDSERRLDVQRADERLRLALKASGTATWEWDLLNDSIAYFESDTSRLLDGPTHELGSQEYFLTYVHPEDLEMVKKAIDQSLHTGLFFCEFRLISRENRIKWVTSRGEVDFDIDGRAVKMLGFAWDSTEVQLVKQASKRELEMAIRSRDEFFAIASHELKTPITSIKLQTQLLVQTFLNRSTFDIAKVVDKLKLIDIQVDRLIVLIDNLLDITMIKNGKLELKRERIDVCAVVASVVFRLSEQAKKRNVEIQLNAPPSAYGWWDRMVIEQIATNLLSNAIKYGAGNAVTISVSTGDRRLRLEVQDRGIGIPKEEQERIFGYFDRLKMAPEVAGLGLGLYVTKKFVDALGGKIQVESELGKGSKFIIELPDSESGLEITTQASDQYESEQKVVGMYNV